MSRDKTRRDSLGRERRDGEPNGVEGCAEVSRRSLPHLGNRRAVLGLLIPKLSCRARNDNLYSSLSYSQIIQ